MNRARNDVSGRPPPYPAVVPPQRPSVWQMLSSVGIEPHETDKIEALMVMIRTLTQEDLRVIDATIDRHRDERRKLREQEERERRKAWEEGQRRKVRAQNERKVREENERKAREENERKMREEDARKLRAQNDRRARGEVGRRGTAGTGATENVKARPGESARRTNQTATPWLQRELRHPAKRA